MYCSPLSFENKYKEDRAIFQYKVNPPFYCKSRKQMTKTVRCLPKKIAFLDFERCGKYQSITEINGKLLQFVQKLK